jgi:DNA-binding Lrp family transcriptional regulator
MTEQTKHMNENEKKIGKVIQGDIALTARPYRQIGEQTGLSEEAVIETIRRLLQEGEIRKFGAILRHQKAGYTRNAMVVWSVQADKTEQAGSTLSAFKEVTHCYERTPAFEGRYNLFTMVHFHRGRNPEEVVRRLAEAAEVKEYKILESLEEFKKSSMEYF